MSASVPLPVSPAPTIEPELLGRFVELLVLAARELTGPPLVLRLRSTPDGIQLASRAVDDLGTALLDRPASGWHGVGVLVCGRARSMGDPDTHMAPGEVIGRAVSAVIVWRDGTVASALSVDGGEPRVQVDRPGDGRSDACGGRLVDLVRRSLGLETPPPAESPTELAVKLWLHRVHAAVASAATIDAATIDALAPPVPATWEAWREQCAEGAWPELGIAPHMAGRMDDGMFAREALGAFPDTVEVLEHLAELVVPHLWEYLLSALARSASP